MTDNISRKSKLSALTVESISDLGYKVDSSQADKSTLLTTTPKLEEEKTIKLHGCIKRSKNLPQDLQWIPPQEYIAKMPSLIKKSQASNN